MQVSTSLLAALASGLLVACTYPSVDPFNPTKPVDQQNDGNDANDGAAPSDARRPVGVVPGVTAGVDAGVGASPPAVTAPTTGGTVKLSVTISGSGIVESSPSGLTCTGQICSGTFPAMSAVTLSALPGPGEEQAVWGGACGGIGTCHLSVFHDETVTAEMIPITGSFTGSYTHSETVGGCTFTNSGTMTVTFGQDGDALTSSARLTGLQLRNGAPQCSLVNSNATGTAPAAPVQGNGLELTGSWKFAINNARSPLTLPFKAIVAGSSMTGTWTCTGCTGDFTLTRQ
jgi:hypothetical protein